MDKQIICFVLCLQQDTRKHLSLFFLNMFICMPLITVCGELAQMVECPLRMRKVPGSIPGFSSMFCLIKILGK